MLSLLLRYHLALLLRKEERAITRHRARTSSLPLCQRGITTRLPLRGLHLRIWDSSSRGQI